MKPNVISILVKETLSLTVAVCNALNIFFGLIKASTLSIISNTNLVLLQHVGPAIRHGKGHWSLGSNAISFPDSIIIKVLLFF